MPRKPGKDRAHRQDLEGHEHGARRLVDVVLDLVAPAEAAAEGHVVEPEHVESGHGRGHEADGPDPAAVAPDLEGRPQDLVLGEEPGQGRDARDGDAADEHGPVGPRHLGLEPAHLAHVLLARHAVDDRAGAEEQQRLEEGVGHQVEDAGREGADPAAQEHVAELADRRVGEHALDVVLHEADGGGEDRGERADDRDRGECRGRVRVDRRRARHHVDAGRDHGRGVDESRDRGRAFHGVGQPDVEREAARSCPRRRRRGTG